ncbi:MAG: NAD(P)/FAD-dependent oxidoreductase [Candidatus Dormibacteria bacterium]
MTVPAEGPASSHRNGSRPLALRSPSYWLETPGYSRCPALQGDCAADVAIIGGGFTGLWSAIRLAEAAPQLRIVVLEAQTAGFGASGRNGGFAMTMVGRNLHDLVRKVGPRQGRQVHLQMVKTLAEIERFCQQEGISVGLTRPGLLTVSNGPEQDIRIEQDLRAASLLGLTDFRRLSKDECRELVAAEGVRTGHFETNALLVDPAALVRGLRDAALSRGIEVYEQTPAVRLRSAGSRLRVETTQGSVHAQQVVIATNAYAQAVPALRRYLFTVCAYITLTEQLSPEQWRRVGWDARMGIEDKRIMPHFHRPTADGRILWGGKDAPLLAGPPDPKRDQDQRIFQRLEESFRWTFPSLGDLAIEHCWGGPVCGTVSCIPKVGWLRRSRVMFALGYSGHGVGPSALVGKTVRDLLLERRSELTELPLVTRPMRPLPPGPFRGPLLSASQQLLQRADDRSGGLDPLSQLALRVLQ